MNRCIYCNKWLGTADTNNVCSECANERKGTYVTTQPIILSRVDFSEKPPTVDEVCMELSRHYKEQVSYSKRHKHLFYFEKSRLGIITLRDGNINFYQSDFHKTNDLPPYLVTLIGRFYEGLEVKE